MLRSSVFILKGNILLNQDLNHYPYKRTRCVRPFAPLLVPGPYAQWGWAWDWLTWPYVSTAHVTVAQRYSENNPQRPPAHHVAGLRITVGLECTNLPPNNTY